MITIEMETSTSAVSIISVEKKKPQIERHYSNETFYSDSSDGAHTKCKSAANALQKRRQLQPMLGSNNPYRRSSQCVSRMVSLHPTSKSTMSMCAQKILSARMLRVKQLQNELSEAHFQINELATENRVLRTLQKRQDVMLKRYEGTQAELPRLIHSHNEEVRMLSSKLKQAKAQVRILDERLKARDSELTALRDRHHHLVELSKDRHLREREQLQQQLEQMQDIVREQDKKLQMLTRKVMLEGKNYKHQLTMEMSRHKAARSELAIALERISKLETVVETRDKYIATNMPRPLSLLSLHPPTRFRGFQSQMKPEVERSVPEKHVLEEEEGEDNEEEEEEGEDDEQQDESQSTFTDPHTNTSLMSSTSLGNGKEVDENRSQVSMDFQAKRFQFSNRYRKHANPVLETTYNESTSGQTTSPPSLEARPGGESEVDASSLGTDSTPSKKTTLQAEMDSIIDATVKLPTRSRRTSLKKASFPDPDKDQIAATHKLIANRRGSLSSLGDIKNKGKELGFISTLMSEMDKEAFRRRGSLKFQGKLEECCAADGAEDNTAAASLSWKKDPLLEIPKKGREITDSSKIEDKTQPVQINEEICEEDDSQLYQVTSQEIFPVSISRRGSLTTEEPRRSENDISVEEGSRERVRSRRDSIESEKHTSMEDTCQRLQEISQSWGELQDKIKSETEWAQSMVDKQLADPVDLDKLEGANKNCSKKALLAALKAIDDGAEPVDLVALGDKQASPVPASYFGGSATVSPSRSNLFQTIENLHKGVPTHSRLNKTEVTSSMSLRSTNKGQRPARRKANLIDELFGSSKTSSNLTVDPVADGIEPNVSTRSRLQRNLNAN